MKKFKSSRVNGGSGGGGGDEDDKIKKKPKSNPLDELDKKGAMILKSKQNVNMIVDLLRHCHLGASSSNATKCRSANVLLKVFITYMSERRFVILDKSQAELYERAGNEKSTNAEQKYMLWMHKRYLDYKQSLFELLAEEKKDNERVKVSSLTLGAFCCCCC
jgi:hypothetical protein